MLARVRHLGCMNSLNGPILEPAGPIFGMTCAASGPSAVDPVSGKRFLAAIALLTKPVPRGYREKNFSNIAIGEALYATYSDCLFTRASYLQYDRSK
jgi:hypothetical protein